MLSRITPEDSEVVKLLSGAVRSVLNVEPRAGGIGGGTFASLFRARGIPAAVWMISILAALVLVPIVKALHMPIMAKVTRMRIPLRVA